ncbi:MAG: transcriptional regulator [Hyphomicrobiales bacterium]|nr:MAG: transcriptional regulator [Hyphomicrobiales bacterium]
MRPLLFAQLSALAARESGDRANAEDVVQEALLVAVEAGRFDLTDLANRNWLRGIVRNKARMSRRGASRRVRRDSEWQAQREAPGEAAAAEPFIADLPPALRIVAVLVVSGHSRHEIAYLLRLSDTALRQRIVALKRRMQAAGLAAPREFTGLSLGLAYGRIRDALLPQLLRQQGVFASHDPDGHLFVVRRSQTD